VVESEGDKWIRLEVNSTEEPVEFAVIDSGPGVPAEFKTKITEAFFTTKPVGKGTGLGLSLSQAIVEEHGGQLKFGERQKHTCFSFVLPRFKEPENATEGRDDINCR
jgi:signal transduction histidine kinase